MQSDTLEIVDRHGSRHTALGPFPSFVTRPPLSRYRRFARTRFLSRQGCDTYSCEPIQLAAVVARNRLCERAMTHGQLRMTPAQMASLLDAAFRAPEPLTFLDATVSMLRLIGRAADSTTAAWMGCLLAEGELEVLMGLRAAWRRGEDRSVAEAARAAMRAVA